MRVIFFFFFFYLHIILARCLRTTLRYVQHNLFAHRGEAGLGRGEAHVLLPRSVRLGAVTRDRAGWARPSTGFGIEPPQSESHRRVSPALHPPLKFASRVLVWGCSGKQ